MLEWQNCEGVTAESIRRQQADWQVSVLKTKLTAKKMSRAEFDLKPFFWRSKYIKNGGKVVDVK